MRAAITGSSGFIGNLLAQELTSAGHTLNVLVRSAPARGSDNVQVFSGELPDVDAKTLDSFLKGCDVLYHLAGVVSRRPEDASRLMRIHVDGTRVLLEAARRTGVGRVVLLSTSGTVGISRDAAFVASDDSPYALEFAMDWPYYSSKIYQEKLALAWARESERSLIALRPSLVLGPGDERGSSTGDVLKFLRRKLPVVPPGGLSFVDVRDVIAACLTAATIDIPDLAGRPRTYLLGSVNWTMERFFRTLERLSGVPAPARGAGRAMIGAGAAVMRALGPRIEKLIDTDAISLEMSRCYWYINSAKAETELGWKHHPPEQTLSDTIAYLRMHGD